MMTVTPVPVSDPLALRLLRAYLDDIITRYFGRPATAAEIDTELAADPADGFAVFLVASVADAAVGCAAVRLGEPGVAELKRMFVVPAARGRGVGAALVTAAERYAAGHGVRAMTLDTRTDLEEARRLYARCGYVEVAGPEGGRRYADHWFRKELCG